MENINNSSKMLMLTTSDSKEFAVPEAVAKESQMIRDMIENNCIITRIPLDNVNAEYLTKILTYCQKHAEEKEKAAKPHTADGEGSSSALATPEESKVDLREWDKEFLKDYTLSMLYDMLLACNYLNVEGLLDLTAQTIAGFITGKSVEEIRETFNIKGDFTPEEEEQIRSEHPWAFQKEN